MKKCLVSRFAYLILLFGTTVSHGYAQTGDYNEGLMPTEVDIEKMNFEWALEWRCNRQSEIRTYSDLPGTVWIMDLSQFETVPLIITGYLFLSENKIIRMEFYAERIEDNRELVDCYFQYRFILTSINFVTPYELENGSLRIFDKLFCRLEDTYLYFGDDSYGYEKYGLWDDFSVFDTIAIATVPDRSISYIPSPRKDR